MTDVEVIIPVYNGAALVGRALASVLAQSTDATMRVHVIDDASTDGSLAVVNALAAGDVRVRVSSNPANAGVSVSRTRGVRESDAPFIAFLDQDDVWLADQLAPWRWARSASALTMP
ncbi:MAG: glycosyltransferase family A protein, partial [Rhodoglobus sp.]